MKVQAWAFAVFQGNNLSPVEQSLFEQAMRDIISNAAMDVADRMGVLFEQHPVWSSSTLVVKEMDIPEVDDVAA